MNLLIKFVSVRFSFPPRVIGKKKGHVLGLAASQNPAPLASFTNVIGFHDHRAARHTRTTRKVSRRMEPRGGVFMYLGR
jgi:hypothetical protein